MKKVLVVNSNPKPTEMSYGLRLGEHYLAALQARATLLSNALTCMKIRFLSLTAACWIAGAKRRMAKR